MNPVKIDSLKVAEVTGATDPKISWSGAYIAWGGQGTIDTVVITFKIPPGHRLGRHWDSAEETQYITAGSGELVRDSGSQAVSAGSVVVLPVGEFHDLVSTGDEPLTVYAVFSSAAVNQHWDEPMNPGNTLITGSPNAPFK